MLITIIADASFCPDTKVAGYAYWIICKRGKKGGDGTFKGPVESNIIAEMMALLNALQGGLTSKVVRHNDQVLLQTDCQPAIDTFKKRRRRPSTKEKELIHWLDECLRTNNIAVRFRHVKGHSGRDEGRYVANAICDRKARRNMRKARTIIQNGETKR